MVIYEPHEDSELLAKHVAKLAKGKVLDMGTGSGIQATTAAKREEVKSVLAVDIQEEVVEYCKKTIKDPKIKVIQSDLFENINEKFDTIIFNPPYLPDDAQLQDLTLDGGKKGYEVVLRFLDSVSDHLAEQGTILLLFSSLTKKEKVESALIKFGFEFDCLDQIHIFFEDLYVYSIKKKE